jgi:2-polyprenyl-3-methyl-5-hydroxy-6-metoxy-1,4-benzoquinol methylase
MMNEYILERNQGDDELLRLRMIEEALDPATIALLHSTGIRAGWRCLEIGAGGGSIAVWMGTTGPSITPPCP